MIVNPLIHGGGTISLAATGYTAGDKFIENVGVPCMPFLAKAWSGAISNQITQGTNGIALSEQGYISMPFTGFNFPSWQVGISMRPTALLGSSFTTFVTLFDTSNNSEFGVSYYKNSDRVYYAVENTTIAEPINADVVPGSFNCYEDNGFKSANILNNDLTITFIGDETYITVYLNGSPRVRAARAKISRSDNIELRVGCCIARSDIRSFTGDLTVLKIH